MDFDFDLDFDFDTFEKPTLAGLVKKINKKDRILFNIKDEYKQLDYLIEKPPTRNQCFKMISTRGGFSSLAIIYYLAKKEGIDEMYVSTFRIGKKHFQVLEELHDAGKLGKLYLLTSSTQEQVDGKASYKGTEYNYYDYILEVCKNNGWKIKSIENHSKIILIKTKNNHYVIETSSNLNENPKIEQFSWENDKELHDWYKELFIELLK